MRMSRENMRARAPGRRDAFPEMWQGREEGVNGTLVHAKRELAAFQTLQFGEPFLDFVRRLIRRSA